MGIDEAEVLRIARLARLQVSTAEAARLAGDLERIVQHIDSLKEVELPPDAASLTYFGRDVVRDDAARDGLDREAALRNAPETDGSFFLVPKIVDKDDA